MNVDLAPNAFIIGPNSAGKSTVIESIALAERCLQIARRKAPTRRVKHAGEERKAYSMPLLGEEDADDPVRFDFGRDEARASIFWQNGSSIHMVWPADSSDEDADTDAFFYLVDPRGLSPRSIPAVREQFEPVTVVPVVTPLDRVEEMKNLDYVRRHASSRLASRHFRNHAFQMQQDGSWSDFREWSAEWLPEIELLDVEFVSSANRLAVFYREPGSRVPKELAWTGDGVQIWLQLLWHLFRASQQAKVILLDEPEVYLHPDLQRRLVRLLEAIAAQVVLASHSADVVTEAPPDSVVWIDRRTNSARKPTTDAALAALGSSIGSSFNLALARAGRVRLALATDTQDVRLLRALARHVGALRIANEQALTIIQLRDATTWAGEGLRGNLRALLPTGVPTIVLLEPRFRTARANAALADAIETIGAPARIWARNELTNYVLDRDTLARVSGAAPEAVQDHLVAALEELGERTRAQVIAEAVRSSRRSDTTASMNSAAALFDQQWIVPGRRLALVRGQDVLTTLNTWFESEDYKVVAPYALGRAIRPGALDSEVYSLLLEIDDMAS